VAKLREMKTDKQLLLFKCELGAGHFSVTGRWVRRLRLRCIASLMHHVASAAAAAAAACSIMFRNVYTPCIVLVARECM
jgi:hypothetical protein